VSGYLSIRLRKIYLVKSRRDRSGSRQGPVEGSCEHGDEPSGSFKCWEVREWLHKW
jgi:hypothetical protein